MLNFISRVIAKIRRLPPPAPLGAGRGAPGGPTGAPTAPGRPPTAPVGMVGGPLSMGPVARPQNHGACKSRHRGEGILAMMARLSRPV